MLYIMLLDEMPEILTAREVAEFLRLSPITVKKMLEKGTIKGARTTESKKGTWLIRRSDLIKYLDK